MEREVTQWSLVKTQRKSIEWAHYTTPVTTDLLSLSVQDHGNHGLCSGLCWLFFCARVAASCGVRILECQAVDRCWHWLPCFSLSLEAVVSKFTLINFDGIPNPFLDPALPTANRLDVRIVFPAARGQVSEVGKLEEANHHGHLENCKYFKCFGAATTLWDLANRQARLKGPFCRPQHVFKGEGWRTQCLTPESTLFVGKDLLGWLSM